MDLSKQNEKLEKKNEELDSHMVNEYIFEFWKQVVMI